MFIKAMQEKGDIFWISCRIGHKLATFERGKDKISAQEFRECRAWGW